MRSLSRSKKTQQLPSAMPSIRHCLKRCYSRCHSIAAPVSSALPAVEPRANTAAPPAVSLLSSANDSGSFGSKEAVTPFDQLASGGLAAPLSRLQHSPPELSITLFHAHLRQHHCNSQRHAAASAASAAAGPSNPSKYASLPEWPIIVYNYALRAYLRAGRRADAYRLLALLETDPERKMTAGLAVNDATIELILSDLVLHTPRTKPPTAPQSSSRPLSPPDKYQAEVCGAIGAVNMSRMVDDLFGRIRGKKSTAAWTARLLAFCHLMYCSEHVVADNLPSSPAAAPSLGKWQTDEFKAYLERSSEFIHRIRQFRDAFSDDPYALAAVVPRLMHACVKREIWPAVYYLLDIIQADGHRMPENASVGEREVLLLPTQSVFRILSIYTLSIWSSARFSLLSSPPDSPPPFPAPSSKSPHPPKPSDDNARLQSASDAVAGNTALLTRQTRLVVLPLARYLWRRLPEDAISGAMAERWLGWATRVGTPLATDVALKCYRFLLQSSSTPSPPREGGAKEAGREDALLDGWSREEREEALTRKESARICLHRSVPLDCHLDSDEGKQNSTLCSIWIEMERLLVVLRQWCAATGGTESARELAELCSL